MKRGLAGAALFALLVLGALVLLRPEPATAPPSPARGPNAAAPSTAPDATRPGDAPGPAGGPAAGTPALAASVRTAALLRHLRGRPLPGPALDALRAGDLPRLAEVLGATPGPAAALALAELADLCRDLPAAGAESTDADARHTLDRLARDPRAAATLAALGEARRAARETLAAGCAAARFDGAAIAQRVQAAAFAGDGRSLERLALTGVVPASRLESAALLGAPRAQLRLGLDHLGDAPAVGRSWLEAAAKDDPDAAAIYGACLLSGCAGPPDPAAARATLEAAARRGAPLAFGLLAFPGADEEARRWSPSDAPVAPVSGPATPALDVEPGTRLAWATLAADLASRGCFGFDLGVAAEALGGRAQLERALSPAESAAAGPGAAAFAAATGANLARTLGCE